MAKRIKQKFIVETETKFTSEDILYALRDNFTSDNLSVKEDESANGTPPFIEGKEITTHPPIVPEHFKHERRTVELAVGQLDNTWHTTNVDIPKDTPDDIIEEVAVKQLTKELGSQEVAFITLYHIPTIEG
jgi:hypothetical protein